MRIAAIILLMLFALAGLSSAAEEPQKASLLIKLIYEEGYLINAGQEAVLAAEVVNPFYRYLGDIPPGKRINVSDIKTKFTVQYSARQWIGGYEVMNETFIPTIGTNQSPANLDVKAELKGFTLFVRVSSPENISSVFIEVPPDIPIKIADDRIRYVLSNIGVRGQNIKSGPAAQFELFPLSDQPFYQVPIQVTYVYQGQACDRFLTFSFKKEDLNHVP